MDAAHARGVIHRDVKPANILLEDRHAWLTDFGVGKASRAPTRPPGRALVRTTSRRSCLAGAPADARSDVYALGCVLFEALTGRPPFRRETEVATL